MKVEVRKSFVRDSQKLSSQNQVRLAKLMKDIPYLKTVFEIPHCKKMQGHKNAYRIRFGEYRIGFYHINDVVELVRILPRNAIYRSFP